MPNKVLVCIMTDDALVLQHLAISILDTDSITLLFQCGLMKIVYFESCLEKKIISKKKKKYPLV